MTEVTDRYANLSGSLGKVLFDLTQNPSPHVPNPPGSKKRASVALVIRVRPTFGHEPAPTEPNTSLEQPQNLETFFAQDWVKHGSPEALFIKRVDRSGDRWSGHVALPGGRRDPEDESDLAVAIRETWEEVGLDLKSKECIHVGNLPERVISTTWGHQVLMVICPYVFLWTSPENPSLRLQPTEIGSTHWVPIAGLLSPSLRTQHLAEFTDRLLHRRGTLIKSLVRSIIGMMSFSAVRLIPSESLYSTAISDFVPSKISATSSSSLLHLRSLIHLLSPPQPPQPPALDLWGLTLGILADFLDQFPPHDAVKLWTYPTFTPPDLQFFIWIMTYTKRKANARNLNDGMRNSIRSRRPSIGQQNQTAIDATIVAIAIDEPNQRPSSARETISGTVTPVSGRTHAVGTLLDGYYDRMKVAIAVFLAWRVLVGSSAALLALRWFVQKRRSA